MPKLSAIKTHIESIDQVTRRITVNIPAEIFDKALAEQLQLLTNDPNYSKKLAATATDGEKFSYSKAQKVPLGFVQSRFNEVAPVALQIVLKTAIDQLEFIPVNEMIIESITKESNGAINVIATFDIIPELNDIHIVIPRVEESFQPITAEDIQQVIETLQAKHAQWISVNAAAMLGNQLTVDFYGKIDGKTFNQATMQDYKLILGSQRMMPGFEEKLVGALPGETRVFDLSFSHDYFIPEVAGKLATFFVTIKQVDQPEFREVDADFIKLCGIPSGTMLDLVVKIKEALIKNQHVLAKQKLKMAVFTSLLEHNNFVIPDALLTMPLQPHEKPSPYMNQEQTVRLSLLVAALIKKFNLVADPHLIEEKINTLAEIYKDPEALKQSYYTNPMKLSEIETMVLEDQLVDLLLKQY